MPAPSPVTENGFFSLGAKAGYQDAAHMAKDTDLDPLRSRDDFKKLLAELAKQEGKQSGGR